MKPFNTLTKRGQLQRLRQVGLAALAAYDLPAPRLIPLHHLENTTFRVLTADHQHYVLRIQRADRHSPEAIRSEMQWLTALHQDTALRVPEPVRTRAGSLLVIAEAPGMPEPRTCVLFRWLAGRFFDKTLTPGHHTACRQGNLVKFVKSTGKKWQHCADKSWYCSGTPSIPHVASSLQPSRKMISTQEEHS